METLDIADAPDAIAELLEVNPDDVVVEVRSGGRTTIATFADGERRTVAHLTSPEHLSTFLVGLKAHQPSR